MCLCVWCMCVCASVVFWLLFFFSFTLGVEGQLTVTRLCTHIHAPVRASHPSRSGVSATYRWRASNKHEHNLDLHIYKGGKKEPKRNSKIHVNSGTNQTINTPMESNDMFHLENKYFCDYYSFNLTIFKEETKKKVRKERKAVKID